MPVPAGQAVRGTRDDKAAAPAVEPPAKLHLPGRGPALLSIRASLLLSLLGMVLLITLALLGGLAVSAGRLERLQSTTIIQARTQQVAAQLGRFFSPVDVLLAAVAQQAAVSRQTDREPGADPAELVRLLQPAPQVDSLRIVRADGRAAFLHRHGANWLYATASNADSDELADWSELDAQCTTYLQKWNAAWREDWYSADWYQGAVGLPEGQVHWTEPYRFEKADDPGISASMTLPDGAASLVVAADILVSDLDEFTDDMRPTPHGYVVLSDRAGNLLEPISDDEDRSSATESEDLGEERLPIEQDHALMAAAFAAWKTPAAHDGSVVTSPDNRDAAAEEPAQVFQFESGGRQWWGGMLPFALGNQAHFLICVLVPVADLQAEVLRQRNFVLLILLAALLVAVSLAALLSRGLGAPIMALATQSGRLRRLDVQYCEEQEIYSHVREVVQLAEAHASMRSALDSFSRYIPVEVVRELLDRGEAARIGGELKSVCVLISDIRAFTALCNTMSPELLAAQLAEYFECLLQALNEHGATVDKLVGDSVIAFWGAPRPDEQLAQHAVSATLAAVTALDALNAVWARQGRPELTTKFGLALGDVIVGNIGAPARLNYTVLGDAVNLASRLEQLCPEYGARIIATATVRDACGDMFAWRHLDSVAIRGRQDETVILEPLGMAS